MLASLLSGQLAGLAMAVILMIVFRLALGQYALLPVQLIGALFLGEQALAAPSPGNLFTGLVAHQLGPSLFWSLAFGVAAAQMRPRLGRGGALLLGCFVGGVSMIVDVYLLMPRFQRELNGHDLWAETVPLAWDWVAHFAYGLVLGYFFTPLRDRLTGGAEVQRPL